MAGRISEYLTLSKVLGTELVDVSAVDAASPTGYTTLKTTVQDLADFDPSIYSTDSDLSSNRTVNQDGKYLVFNNGDFGLDEDNQGFFYEDLTRRVGIGTNTPSSSLHIKGQSGDDLFILENSLGDEKLKIDSNDVLFYDDEEFLSFNGSSGQFQIGRSVRSNNLLGTYTSVQNELRTSYIRGYSSITGLTLALFTTTLQSIGNLSTPQVHHRATNTATSHPDGQLYRFDDNGSDVLVLNNDGRIKAPNLPTSSSGLVSGDIWNDAGTLKIV